MGMSIPVIPSKTPNIGIPGMPQIPNFDFGLKTPDIAKFDKDSAEQPDAEMQGINKEWYKQREQEMKWQMEMFNKAMEYNSAEAEKAFKRQEEYAKHYLDNMFDALERNGMNKYIATMGGVPGISLPSGGTAHTGTPNAIGGVYQHDMNKDIAGSMGNIMMGFGTLLTALMKVAKYIR